MPGIPFAVNFLAVSNMLDLFFSYHCLAESTIAQCWFRFHAALTQTRLCRRAECASGCIFQPAPILPHNYQPNKPYFTKFIDTKIKTFAY